MFAPAKMIHKTQIKVIIVLGGVKFEDHFNIMLMGF